MSYIDWDIKPNIFTQEYCMWITVENILDLAWRLRGTRFEDPQARKKALTLMNLNLGEIAVTPTTRFPKQQPMVNLDEPALAAILNKIRSGICQLDLVDRLKGIGECARAISYHKECSNNVIKSLDELQKYVMNENNTWTRYNWEKNCAALVWKD